jgi:hypothetical protein
MDISEILNIDREHDVGGDEFEAVFAIFGNKKLRFDGQHARSAADALAAKQKNLHTAAFSMIGELARLSGLDIIIRARDFLTQSFVSRLLSNTNFSVQKENEGFSVVTNNSAPIILEEEVERFKSQFSGRKSALASYNINLAALFFAAYIRAARGAGIDLDFNQLGGMANPIRSAIAKLEAYALLKNRPTELDDPLAQLRASIGEIGTQLQGLEHSVQSETEKVGGLQLRYEALEKHAAAFVNKTAEMDGQFVALRHSIEEQLWGNAGWWAGLSFYISAGILLASLTAIPITAFIYRGDILTYMQALEQAMVAGASGNNEIAATVSAFGRLILISAPLGFIVWLIKLIVRYNTRSLLLMDDARQRVTMLNTYLFLIEQDAAVKQDRGAILEALFRRAPGHGGDTVEPPHFTDLLRYGQETAPKVS